MLPTASEGQKMYSLNQESIPECIPSVIECVCVCVCVSERGEGEAHTQQTPFINPVLPSQL